MNKKLYKLMDWPRIESVIYSEERDPFSVLGPHTKGNNTLFQMFYPNASKVSIIFEDGKDEKTVEMEMADELGFFAALIPGKTYPKYKYKVTLKDKELIFMDAYAYSLNELPQKEVDLFLNGINYNAYDLFGAKECEVLDVKGVRFTLWAPNALSVSVVGDFNGFADSVHQMCEYENSGIFTLFIPDAKVNDRYQFSIHAKGGNILTKADPFSRSIIAEDQIYSLVSNSSFSFSDDKYIKNRKKMDIEKPFLIYETSLYDSYFDEKDIKIRTERILKEVSSSKYTHILIRGVNEADTDSMNAMDTLAFFTVSNKIGSADDLKYFVNKMHENNIGVIFSLNTFNFSLKEGGLSSFDGTYLYGHLDEEKRYHPFYGTGLFNYGRKEVSDYLLSNVFYFINEFHVDGYMLEEIPCMLYYDYGKQDKKHACNIYGGNENLEAIEFIKHLNSVMQKKYPDVLRIAMDDSGYPNMTAELSEEGLGFDLKINTALYSDINEYLKFDPYFRSHHHTKLTNGLLYQYKDKFINALSFDLINNNTGTLYSQMPGNDEEKIKNIKLLISYMMLHPGKKLVMSGLEAAQENSYDIFSGPDYSCLKNESHQGLKKMMDDLEKLYLSSPALFEQDCVLEGFEWINCIDSDRCLLSFLRKSKNDKDIYLVVFNFANLDQKVKVGSPIAGKYKEIFSSEVKKYAGNAKENKKTIPVSETEADGKPYSVEIAIKALGVVVYKYIPFSEKEKYAIEKKKEAAIAMTKASLYAEDIENAKKEYLEAKERMEKAKNEMNEASLKEKEAQKLYDNEILKAKKAIAESELI